MKLEQIVIASGNAGKIVELRALLTQAGIAVTGLSDHPPIEEPDEPYDTFEANAIHKAEYYGRALGLPVLADDSGICIDALDGAPGVYSARFAGEPRDDERNNDKVLQELSGVPDDQRTAHYACVLALFDGAVTRTFEGKVYGRILHQRSGSGGFGYDPLFIPDGYDVSFGHIPREVKGTFSHRANALTKLLAALQ